MRRRPLPLRNPPGKPTQLSEGRHFVRKLPDEEQRPIGIWGQRHLRYLRQHRKVLYTELQITGKLNDYLADLNNQAENMILELVKQMAACEDITEQLKAQNQMLWVQRMNIIWDRVMEIVNHDLIDV